MKSLSELIRSYRERRIVKRAEDLFQVREYNEDLWLTNNGNLVCPTDMLYGDDSIKRLQEIRKLYIERNTNAKWKE